jgi:hypothetical protein
MAHYPLNHPSRPLYRFLAALSGLYLLLHGIIGLATTWGDGFFHRGSDWVLGLRTNPASAGLAALAGLILVAAALLGGNLFHHVAIVLGWGIAAYAAVVMALIQTDANVFNVSMVNVITLFTLSVIVLTAGLYGKVGHPDH